MRQRTDSRKENAHENAAMHAESICAEKIRAV